MTARITTQERLSELYKDDREKLKQTEQEGQQRAAEWMAPKLPPNHPQYAAWKHALVNGLPWPPQEER